MTTPREDAPDLWHPVIGKWEGGNYYRGTGVTPNDVLALMPDVYDMVLSSWLASPDTVDLMARALVRWGDADKGQHAAALIEAMKREMA